MNFGFNSKAQIGLDLYDVQTEERSTSRQIDTVVLNRGRIAYRHSTSFEDLAETGVIDQAILRARVEKQHREILQALREGALSLEKAPPKNAGIAVKLLNSASWLEAGHVLLDIEVLSKSAGQPVTGAEVEAFIEGSAGTPESHFGRTDAAGRTSLRFPFPTLAEPALAALVIRAQIAEGRGELRYQLTPRKTNR